MAGLRVLVMIMINDGDAAHENDPCATRMNIGSMARPIQQVAGSREASWSLWGSRRTGWVCPESGERLPVDTSPGDGPSVPAKLPRGLVILGCALRESVSAD
jgi:hypothetical protein